jgi:uncharacterized protein (TIGR00661 family)
MKILYAIQGTGNGHISRAREIIPMLQRRCETDILISGSQADIELPFEVKFRLHGLGFDFGKRGGIDLRKTYNKANTKRLLKEIKELPVAGYDFVLNDFEPVSAWACYRKKVPCIALSHQFSLLDKNVPKPAKKDALGSFILKNYAPASAGFGFHFSRYSGNIYTPVIRKEIREAENTNHGHYTVYLPAYDDKTLVKVLSGLPETRWQVFSKHNKMPETIGSIELNPVDDRKFGQSLTTCAGVLCAAGFETPAEALFLGKKLMVIPMQNQHEQQYNAAALKGIGVPVLKRLKASKVGFIKEWINSDYRIEITYPDVSDRIISHIFELYVEGRFPRKKWQDSFQFDMRKYSSGK